MKNESYPNFDLVFSPSSLDGMSNEQARNFVRKTAKNAYHTGLYKDEFWEGPNNIKKAFNEAGIEYETLSADYHNWPPIDTMKSSSKDWKLAFPFVNNKGKKTILYGTITAAGAGSVQDPLDRYDMNFTVFEENKQNINENMKNPKLNLVFQALTKRLGNQKDVNISTGADDNGEFVTVSSKGKEIKIYHNGRNFVVNGEELTPQAIVPSSRKPFLKHAIDTLQLAEGGNVKEFVQKELSKLKKKTILENEKKKIEGELNNLEKNKRWKN